MMAEAPNFRFSLPYLTADLAGVGGVLKQIPEDFEVEEIPAYEPSGTGEHLFLWVEKRNVSGERLSRHVSHALGISPGDIGVAGLKDRRAVTRQYLSVPARYEDRVPAIETDQIRVLRAIRHANKLRTGHLRGNRFSILVRGVEPAALGRAEPIAERIERLGFPNYYGEQRFGEEEETLRLGIDLLTGRQTPRDLPGSRRRFLLRMSLSAVQSELFNRTVAERLNDGLLHTVLFGDVMEVVGSGGRFRVADAGAEQRRFDSREIVTTGPMFGPKMMRPDAVPAEREARVLADAGLTLDQFSQFKQLMAGTRRAFLIWPSELSMSFEPEGLRFRFSLPSGVYATTLLREFMKDEPHAETQSRNAF